MRSFFREVEVGGVVRVKENEDEDEGEGEGEVEGEGEGKGRQPRQLHGSRPSEQPFRDGSC